MTDADSNRYLFRKLDALEGRLERLERRVDEMTKADEIAQAVVAAQRADRKHRFNRWRLLAGGVASLLLLVPAAHELVLILASL